ncbi:Mitochondrial intermediate peptidase [Elasticomyces elasticus]|nr:Mitochondrial intermediate peptidase [Elasticomyces elasticus]
MLQRVPKPWTCSRCFHAQRRRLVTSSKTRGAVAAARVADYEPASHASPSTTHDDRTLRQIFDSPGIWKEFSAKNKHGKNAGLFQNRYLTHPAGFQEFASVTLAKCKKIVAAVLSYETTEELKKVARDLDRLSDLLCRVIDLSDFVRSVHPDRKVVAAATEAYGRMFEYMNILNTTTGLNSQLKKAQAIPEVYASWTEEERTVAAILIKDFSKSAIDLPDAERKAFVDISNEIAVVGNEFVENMGAAQPTLSFESSRLKGMDPLLVRQMMRWGSVTLPTVGMPATIALRTVEDEATRKEIYMANRTSSRDNLQRLEQMLKRRAELAKLSGYESYAHMTLTDKMAKSPEAVSSFLDALAKENALRVKDELAELLRLKDSNGSGGPDDGIKAWDRDFYTAKLVSAQRLQGKRTPDFLSAYFSLGTVMQGLSRLFHRLYGLRLVPRETLAGETWNPDVRRLDVVDDIEGHVAVIYCDLFERQGKSPNPAHFTLRCSRRISEEEIEEESEQLSSLFASAEEAANDGLATNINARDGNALYQLPTIALICDFALPPHSSSASNHRPSLLSFREVTTLFHEMGHALHSICGRTGMQNVSGTRCATDFAELPSVLMENFASAPEVLGLYARHWETDAPLDPTRIRERVEAERRMQGAEIESQVLLGVLDQRLHGSAPLGWRDGGKGGESTGIYRDVWREYSSVGEPGGTSWQGFFGHLFGYGGTYYSYLFDRAIAGKIWQDVFQRSGMGAVDPESGHRLREEVLRHGGGRDGWRCVAGVLGDERLGEGGAEAMKEVGRWGVHG